MLIFSVSCPLFLTSHDTFTITLVYPAQTKAIVVLPPNFPIAGIQGFVVSSLCLSFRSSVTSLNFDFISSFETFK